VVRASAAVICSTGEGGRVALLAQVRQHHVREVAVRALPREPARGVVAEVAVAPRDPVAHRRRVRAAAQHRRVVVRLEHEHVHVAQRLAHRLRRVPEVVAHGGARA
jgi:hypothetical protein